MIVFQLLLLIAAPIAFGRMAEADRGEGLKWGAITFGLCLLCLFIPLPFLNMLIGLGLSFGLMTMTKKTYY